jgi:hypothetical protein
MYKSFYSLARAPFSKDICPSDAFPSTEYQGALSALNYLQKSKGMGLLIGDPGAGKTFTLRSSKESLNPSLYHVVYFPLSIGGVMDFYCGLVYGLGEEPKFRKVDLEKDCDWFVTLDRDVRFILHTYEVYKFQITKQNFMQINAPF